MKNLILLFVLFAALLAAIPAEAGNCGGVGFVPSGFGFVPSGFGFSSRAVILDNRPIVLNGGGFGGSFERREFRGPFGARRTFTRFN